MKAKIALVLAAALAAGGFLPVLYFAGLVAWQLGMLVMAGKWTPLPASMLFTDHSTPFVPAFPMPLPDVVASALGRVHVGVIFALVGLAIAPLGIHGVKRQRALMRAEKQQREDRLRRVDDYWRDGAVDERREPFIGADDIPHRPRRRAAY